LHDLGGARRERAKQGHYERNNEEREAKAKLNGAHGPSDNACNRQDARPCPARTNVVTASKNYDRIDGVGRSMMSKPM
jgi:hypothetical protein